MFWTVAAILTALSVAVVIYPLTRKARKLESADDYDLTIYKSQLAEIEQDVKRGLIDVSEAEAARAEVARRVLAAQSAIDEQTPKPKSKKGKKGGEAKKVEGAISSTNVRIAGVVALMLIPFVTVGLYFTLGSPNLQSQPLAGRLSKPPEQQSMTELVASTELRLKNNPDDLVGWKRLAPIYMSIRRPDKAIEALHQVLRLEGETVATLSDIGEAMVVREAGIVSESAFRLFKRANGLDAQAPKPRFFLAIGLGQQGKEQEAIETWQSMINDFPADAPWVPFAKTQIASLAKRIATGQAGKASTMPPHASMGQTKEQAIASNADAGAPGPTSEDMKAAAEMNAEDRQQMIESMVAGLAERLDSEGGTAEEWVRLIRAELVLNRPDMAAKTVTKAMDALQSDLDGLEKVKAAARSLGVSINQ